MRSLRILTRRLAVLVFLSPPIQLTEDLGSSLKMDYKKEEEENNRLMREKIVKRVGSPHRFGCKDCPWKGKFSHKAKGHARVCGLRRRMNTRKPKENSYECSGQNCPLSFSLLSQLHDHYR